MKVGLERFRHWIFRLRLQGGSCNRPSTACDVAPCFLTSECELQAKSVPETAQAAFEKACKGLGLSRISKISFWRFHRVFRLANIKTMFDALRRPCNYFKTARSWNEKPCNALGKTESPKSSFAGSIAFWQIWTSTSCLRGACGFSGFFGFYFRSANLGFA